MGFFDSDEDKVQNAHNEGQADGSEGAGAWTTFNKSVAYELTEGKESSDAYEAGLENGRNNPADE